MSASTAQNLMNVAARFGDKIPTVGIFSNRVLYALAAPSTDDTVIEQARTASERRLVCTSGNRWGFPAKDRSGRLAMSEPPDLGALLAKIDGAAPASPALSS